MITIEIEEGHNIIVKMELYQKHTVQLMRSQDFDFVKKEIIKEVQTSENRIVFFNENPNLLRFEFGGTQYAYMPYIKGVCLAYSNDVEFHVELDSGYDFDIFQKWVASLQTLNEVREFFEYLKMNFVTYCNKVITSNNVPCYKGLKDIPNYREYPKEKQIILHDNHGEDIDMDWLGIIGTCQIFHKKYYVIAHYYWTARGGLDRFYIYDSID